ncbi:MAG: AI-2E family transporter [Tissierellia bacterium]|nr:AI-2E family transporter [Tissierellia bacterium]
MEWTFYGDRQPWLPIKLFKMETSIMITQSPVLIRNLIFLTSILMVFIIYYLIHIGNRYVEDSKKIRIRDKRFLPILIMLISIYIFYLLSKRYGILSDMVYTIMISLIIAYLLNPIVNYFEKYNISRGLGVLIIYLIIVGIIFIISFLIIPKSGKEIKKLLVVLPIYFQRLSEFIDNLYMKYYMSIDNIPPIFQSLEDIILNNIDNIQNVIVTNISRFFEGIISTFTKVISLILIPILTFYFIRDKDYFINRFYLTIPKKRRKEAKELFIEMDRALGQFIRGRLILALYVGVATTILLLILKVDFAIIIGMLTGIADIIPYFGPLLGFLPAFFFALLSSPIKALWIAILFIGIQWVENNVLAPKIIGESIGIHPISILLALVIGGGVFGVMGMVFSVPAIAIFKILFNFFMEKVRKPNVPN